MYSLPIWEFFPEITVIWFADTFFFLLVQIRPAIPISCLVDLFHFLCSLKCQYQQFCCSFASFVVTSRCDLSGSGYLNSIWNWFIILHLPHLSIPSFQGSFIFTQNLLIDKDQSRRRMERSAYSYCLGTLEHLHIPGPGLPWFGASALI